jgi:hypothetical protein
MLVVAVYERTSAPVEGRALETEALGASAELQEVLGRGGATQDTHRGYRHSSGRENTRHAHRAGASAKRIKALLILGLLLCHTSVHLCPAVHVCI